MISRRVMKAVKGLGNVFVKCCMTFRRANSASTMSKKSRHTSLIPYVEYYLSITFPEFGCSESILWSSVFLSFFADEKSISFTFECGTSVT